MAPPSPLKKRRRVSLLEWIIVIGGCMLIIGYNRMTISRLQRALPNVNSQIVGEWKAERGVEHLLFRTDDSVSLTVPAPAAGENGAEAVAGPAPVTGKYKLTQGGRIYIQLMNGKKYSTMISPINPNRFDLIDAETDGVTTYDRVAAIPAGAAKPAPVPAAAEKAPVAPPAQAPAAPPAAPEAAAPPAAPEVPPTEETPAAPAAPPAKEAPAAPK